MHLQSDKHVRIDQNVHFGGVCADRKAGNVNASPMPGHRVR